MFRIVIALALGVGCSSLEAIERGVCGNGLLEPGEDCDSTAETCSSCSITCSATAACPDAYACGVDGLCHAPGGRLDNGTSPTPYAIDEMRVTDIDRDGIGDVVGVSRTAIDVRYGDEAATLGETDLILTPVQGGVPGFSDIDADGSLDIGFGTGDGVVVYTSPLKKLSPLALRREVSIDGVGVEDLFTINSTYFGFIVSRPNNKLEMIIASVLAGGEPIGATGGLIALPAFPVQPLCGDRLTNAAFFPTKVETFVASVFEVADVPLVVDLVVTLTGGSSMGPKSCVMGIRINNFEPNPGDVVKFYEITPANAPPAKLLLARFDGAASGNPCPGIAVPDLAATPPRVVTWGGQMVGTGATAHCGLNALPTPFKFSTAVSSVPAPDAIPVGHVALDPPPTFPIFEGVPLTFGRDAIALSDGIYAPIAGTTDLARIYKTTRPMRRLSTGDFDGDGGVDVVATTDGEDDLDILYRRDYSYQLYRVDTASRITSLQVGDYDGNLASDIAIVEPVEGHDRLSIAYGTPQEVLAPLEVERFVHVAFMSLIGLGSTLDQINKIDDLIVLDRPDADSNFLTILSGSPQRTMLSYFDPRGSSDAMGAHGADATIAGVVFGRFASPAITAAVLGVASSLFDGTTPPQTSGFDPVRVWPMTIDANGLNSLVDGKGQGIQGFTGCSIDSAPTDNVCMPATRYTVWSIGDRDVVIAVDKQAKPKAAIVTMATTTTAPMLTANVPDGATVRSLHAADLDGDGADELVVSFGPSGERDATTAGLVELCAMDASGHPTSCVNVGDAIDGKPTCVDAVPVRFGATPGLAVVCYGDHQDAAIFHVTKTDGALHGALVKSGLGPIRSIQAGDVTGDGVDDILALTGGFGAESLVVYPQCTSRNVECGL